MAQKKHRIELSRVELEHLRTAIDFAQLEHEKAMHRSNPVLTRITKKLDDSAAGEPEDATKGESGDAAGA